MPCPPGKTRSLQDDAVSLPTRGESSTQTEQLSQPSLSLPVNILRVVLEELEQSVAAPPQEPQLSVVEELVAKLQAFLAKKQDASASYTVSPNRILPEPENHDIVASCTDPPNRISPDPENQDIVASYTDSPNRISSNPENQDINAELFPGQQMLVDMFQQLDTDGSNTLSTDELRFALKAANVPQARLMKLFHHLDSDRSGHIDLQEWTALVSRIDDAEELRRIHQGLAQVYSIEGTLFANKEVDDRYPYMLQPDLLPRIAWDLLVLLMCGYVATVQVFVVAWGADLSQTAFDIVRTLNICIDCMFLLDVILNFRTGYYREGELVMDWRRVGRHYAKTWCLLDIASSIPIEDFQVLTSAKLLKVGKLGKIIRVMKPRGNFLDDWLHYHLSQSVVSQTQMMVWLIFLCHWLACGMKLVDDGFLNASHDVSSSISREYLTAIYWAMTTLTTVGYGDITPRSDGERAYTMFAMVVGGYYYGYAVGSITSMVSSRDLNASAFYERMNLVHAWMQHHRLPRTLKQRIRHYFTKYFSEQSALSEAELWRELTPELQKAAGIHVVHDDVKNNPLFDGMALSEVVRLQSILRIVTITAGQEVTTAGDAGTAMYIIVSGLVTLQRANSAPLSLGPGQSFGEEILLGIAEEYEYTTTVVRTAKMQMITEDDFLALFSNMPNVYERMRRNALELHPSWKKRYDSKCEARSVSHLW